MIIQKNAFKTLYIMGYKHNKKKLWIFPFFHIRHSHLFPFLLFFLK